MAEDAITSDDWFSDTHATFGDRLAGAREAAGLSQPDLARRLGVKVKTLRAWENDVSEPRANRLSMLAGLLNVSIMWLLTGEGAGVDIPSDEGGMTEETANLLLELRALRTEAASLATRMGHLEKRLRRSLEG